MATAQRPLTTAQIQVELAAGESTITRGQPAQFTAVPSLLGVAKWPIKLCPDGERPDCFVTTSADIGAAAGMVQVRSLPVNLALIGEDVKRGDLLKVKGGRLVKALATDQAWLRAMFDGKKDDLINVEPVDKTA